MVAIEFFLQYTPDSCSFSLLKYYIVQKNCQISLETAWYCSSGMHVRGPFIVAMMKSALSQQAVYVSNSVILLVCKGGGRNSCSIVANRGGLATGVLRQ